jgi:hypothetical protein
MKLTIIVEKGESELWARIENIPDYLPATSGNDLNAIEQNLRDLLDYYIQNEGAAHEAWRALKASEIAFDYA